MRLVILLLLAGCSVATTVEPQANAAAESSAATAGPFSADAYTPCMACHLADGAGVPGAFPPLRNRSAAIANLDGGREYLIAVASFGLMGTIKVQGMQYFGVMPGNQGTMDAETIAAALNYIVFELNDVKDNVDDGSAFTASEVEKVQASVESSNPQTAFATRKELSAQHGEEWPK